MSKWLLVEDEPELYEILSSLYDAFGSQVIAHATGEDVLAWLEALPRTEPADKLGLPIFALIDIRLPGKINGVEVAAHLRQHPLLHALPIVLMTAYRLSPKEEKYVIKRSGSNRLIYKPLPSFAELRKIFTDLT